MASRHDPEARKSSCSGCSCDSSRASHDPLPALTPAQSGGQSAPSERGAACSRRSTCPRDTIPRPVLAWSARQQLDDTRALALTHG